MISDDEMQGHLDKFLSDHGAAGLEIGAEVTPGLGELALLVASGSVLQGFGNLSSDVDLYVVVDNDSTTEFPLNSYTSGVHFDINFSRASWLRDQLAELEEPVVLAERDQWKSERRRLHRLNRFALGLAVAGTDEWLGWQRTLRRLFPGRAIVWWRNETRRHRVAGELLRHVNPLLAAQRFLDAFLCALNDVCAEAGELYLVEKWVGVKLRRIERHDLADRLDLAWHMPRRPEEVADYVDRLSGWLDELAADWHQAEPLLTLWPADGVEVWRSADRALVHRYGLRGVEFPRGRTAYDLPWTGRAAEVTDEHRLLIREGMVWLSVVDLAS